jgi:SAM-dependent methyltransferase
METISPNPPEIVALSDVQGLAHEPRENGGWTWASAGEHSHHKYILKSIVALMPTGYSLSVLDAGCGNGFIAAHIARLGHRVIGIDSGASGLRWARAAHPAIRYELRTVYDDLCDLMPHGGWDLIVSSEVIEHLSRPLAFLRNMNTHLRSRGAIILTTPYHGYLKNLALSFANAWDRHHGSLDESGHIKFFSESTLGGALIATGFEPPVFRNAGRAPLFWKSIVCRSSKRE